MQGQLSEKDAICLKLLQQCEKKLILNKGQTEEEICPGLSNNIIAYIKKNLNFYNDGFNLHKKK